MATSPNYGWSEPDNASLVKNGAADIRTLGDAIDTSLWNIGFGQAGKNAIINGDCRVAQRGSSVTFATTGYFYGAVDRFQGYSYANNTCTVSQQTFTPGAAPVAGYEGQSFIRISSTSTATFLSYRIEDVRTFAGQTATFSFWAKSNSSQTATVSVSQNFGSGGSATVAGVISGSPALTTSWQRFSYTATIPSISGKTIGTSSYVLLEWVGAANNAIDIWGVQLEYGSKATPFKTATGTIQGELAACQRYYYRFNPNGSGKLLNFAQSVTTTSAELIVPFPVTMRTQPSALEQTGTAADYTVKPAGSAVACSSVPAYSNATEYAGQVTLTVASGLTAGQIAYARQSGATNSYLGWSAEL